mmetsp:Transcript_7112/g.17651  ORF Transcript_7112/g.17651 Transcript_7112/m.17651 type:complete len:278 (-) Transcript_7112:21-854(-)
MPSISKTRRPSVLVASTTLALSGRVYGPSMDAPNWTLEPIPTKLTPVPDALPLVRTFHWPLRSSSAAVPPNTGTSGNVSARASTIASSAPGVALMRMACGCSSIFSLSAATAALPSSASYAVANAFISSLDNRSTPSPLVTEPPGVRTAPLLVRPWTGVSSPNSDPKLSNTLSTSRPAVRETKAMLGFESPNGSLAALTAASAAYQHDSRLLLPNPALMASRLVVVVDEAPPAVKARFGMEGAKAQTVHRNDAAKTVPFIIAMAWLLLIWVAIPYPL